MSEKDQTNGDQRVSIKKELAEQEGSLNNVIATFLETLDTCSSKKSFLNDNIWGSILIIPLSSEEIKVIKDKLKVCQEKLSSLKNIEECSSEELEKERAFFNGELQDLEVLILCRSVEAQILSGLVVCLKGKSDEDPEQRETRFKEILTNFKEEFSPIGWI